VVLDGGQETLVVGEALGKAARPGGVVVGAGFRKPLVHAVLEPVVDQCDEPQQRARLPRLVVALDRPEKVGYMGADGSLRMPPPRLAPGKAGAQMRVLGDRPLELSPGNEPENKFAC